VRAAMACACAPYNIYINIFYTVRGLMTAQPDSPFLRAALKSFLLYELVSRRIFYLLAPCGAANAKITNKELTQAVSVSVGVGALRQN